MRQIFTFCFIMFLTSFCTERHVVFEYKYPKASYENVIPGAERMRLYIPKIIGKNIAVVVNQTSIVNGKHLIDTLLSFDTNIKKIFAPEHGFRGQADAGKHVNDGIDSKTNIPIKSLYGKNKKPSAKDLEGIDIVLFDIQDVGVRFYTYISTMTYMMERCAELGIPFIVLDRPNPNGYYVDGPVLKSGYESFIGLHHVPVVYGMTIGEYAKMVNGEGWLKNELECNLIIVECSNYTHEWTGELPIKPSPNLQNIESILLYPSLCFFEGTIVSVGRGTSKPFQHAGHDQYPLQGYSFVPKSGSGSKYPKLENKTCYGLDFSAFSIDYIKAERGLNLNYLIDFYEKLDRRPDFFLKNKFFDKLAGSDKLRLQILAGKDMNEIRTSWQDDLDKFKKIRKKYLLYT